MQRDRARFEAVFGQFSSRVYGYVRRQCDPADAQDVVAETFLVAWRRVADLPDSPLPWLIVIARNILSDRRRREHRRSRLQDNVVRLQTALGHGPAADEVLLERVALVEALAELTDLEREALLLVAWDGLSTADAAFAVGCSPRAFAVRLSRARTRLARSLQPSAARNDPPTPDPPSPDLPTLAATTLAATSGRRPLPAPPDVAAPHRDCPPARLEVSARKAHRS